MTYFQNLHSLADLKKEYRRLAMQNHPDKGGDTAIMQQVNTEFERLFEVWKDKTDISVASTGYECDYSGATAREYTEYVYNEYRWKGRNYEGQHAPEIVELVRTLAQGSLSEIQVFGQTRKLPFHLHPSDESRFRGFHQRIRENPGRYQPLPHCIRQVPDGSREGGDAECP